MSVVGDEFLRRYATSPMHVPMLERLLEVYGGDDPDGFAARYIAWDRECEEPEAGRVVSEMLAKLVDDNGNLMRLSDELVQQTIRSAARSRICEVKETE